MNEIILRLYSEILKSAKYVTYQKSFEVMYKSYLGKNIHSYI